MQVKFKAKCKECLCNKCCQDAFKNKKDFGYYTENFIEQRRKTPSFSHGDISRKDCTS